MSPMIKQGKALIGFLKLTSEVTTNNQCHESEEKHFLVSQSGDVSKVIRVYAVNNCKELS